MKITKKWLEQKNACQEGIDWFCAQEETDSIKILNKLIKQDHIKWANWIITQLMNRIKKIKYAVYAAEKMLPIFEERFPDDKRPRNAIEAAKNCIKNRADAADAAEYKSSNEEIQNSNCFKFSGSLNNDELKFRCCIEWQPQELKTKETIKKDLERYRKESDDSV